VLQSLSHPVFLSFRIHPMSRSKISFRTELVSFDGICELTGDLSGSPYYSRDMAPVPRAGRRWGMKDIAVLWISMSACIPTYMLASGMIKEGMSWWQAVATIFLGNLIVLVPMVVNAHAGTRYGI